MKLKIRSVIDVRTGEQSYTVKAKGGYGVKVLPDLYLQDEHFVVPSGERKIVFFTRMNPITGRTYKGIHPVEVSFTDKLNSRQVERITFLMRMCGDRLCKIKDAAKIQAVKIIEI